MCAAYYDYSAALTQILRAPCNTDNIGVNPHFTPPAAPQEPMVALPIRCPLPLVHPPRPRSVRSSPSDPSGQSDLYLQANFSHMVKLHKGLIYPINLMILLPQLKIERYTINPILIHISICSALVLPSSFSSYYHKGHTKTINPVPATFTDDVPSSDYSFTSDTSASKQFPSSSASTYSSAFFVLARDSPTPKANFWPFDKKAPQGNHLR